MHPFIILLTIALFTTANLLTTYVYLYPIVKRCAFPEQPAHLEGDKTVPKQSAAFRLLVLGDPQLEGSSSLLPPEYKYFPSLRSLYGDVQATASTDESFAVAQAHIRDLFRFDVPVFIQSWRKRLDLLGNDYYLAHIYRSLQWSLQPTHAAVLGDLIGSQWINDVEFEDRGRRYWDRVFSGARKVEESITGKDTTVILGQDTSWTERVINVAGNHDIGYAGDMSRERVERFDRVFGSTNWQIRFHMPVGANWDKPVPELRVVVLNSLNLDSPVLDVQLQTSTFSFINHVTQTSRPENDTSSATILLTHLPLHKETGVCVDGPYITYHSQEQGGGIKEQNHLSPDSSAGLLHSIFGLGTDPENPTATPAKNGRDGIILTGHDHEGCDVFHSFSDAGGIQAALGWTAGKWSATTTGANPGVPGIREITVRSMMGDFGGNAGLLSAWYDVETSKWDFAYASCALGKQHLWWVVHVLDIITFFVCITVGTKLAREFVGPQRRSVTKEKTQ